MNQHRPLISKGILHCEASLYGKIQISNKTLSVASAERHSCAAIALWLLRSRRQLNLAKLLLIAKKIFLQGKEQTLCMLWGHYDARENLWRRNGKHVREVDYELRA